MLEVDFHSHTLYSQCGIHTVLEMLEAARKKGLKGLAITDHGSALKGRVNNVFFIRFQNPVSGIRLLKGIECNILDETGTIDFPKDMISYMDIVLLGLHFNMQKGDSAAKYTDILLRALDKNPFVDIITHPQDPIFPLDFSRLTKEAASRGIAIEINNSKDLYKIVGPGETESLLRACMDAECRIVINSDAHAVHEIGLDESVKPILKQCDFPAKLWINRSAAAAFAFVDERRVLKKLPDKSK